MLTQAVPPTILRPPKYREETREILNDGRGIVRTRLQLRGQTSTPPPPLDFLGDLVSVVSSSADDEISAAGGHFVSYHQADGNWFINDDNRILKICLYLPSL